MRACRTGAEIGVNRRREVVMKQDRYEQAKKRVEEIKRFYVHLVVYVLVNLGLFAINMIASPGHVWFFWPALGWGIAVAIHAATLIIEGPFGATWEERKIQDLVERDEHDAPSPPHPPSWTRV
jgi:hypothetical protein